MDETKRDGSSGAGPNTPNPAMSFMAADRAIEAIGQRTVVNAGQICADTGVSSNPTTDRSLGMSMPLSRAARIAPAAISSLLAKMAEGRGIASSSRSAAIMPESKV